MSTPFQRPRGPILSIVAVVGGAALLSVSCSGGADASGDLVSISDVENADGAGVDAARVIDDDDLAEIDAETAFLNYADCMRAAGIVFPDPTFNADGGIDRGSFQADRDQEGFPEADDACRGELEGAALGGGRGDFRETLQAGLLDFTECIRDLGYQVDDLTFGEGGPGGGGPAGGGPGGGGPGGGGQPPEDGAGDGFGPGAGVQRDGGQAGERLAAALGLDADDPEVANAIEECQPVLTEAIGDGPGAAAAE